MSRSKPDPEIVEEAHGDDQDRAKAMELIQDAKSFIVFAVDDEFTVDKFGWSTAAGTMALIGAMEVQIEIMKRGLIAHEAVGPDDGD